MAVPRVALGTLGPLLGSGGQAKVYAVPSVRLPDVAGPLVFKHYRPGQEPPAGLHALVLRRLRMDLPTRDRLDVRTAWPVRTVQDGGAVCGVLMPLIPDDYFHTRYLPSGAADRSLCEFQHLFVDPERARRLGMPVPGRKARLALCRDFAGVMHLLHTNNFVIGDINAKNAVFRLNAGPSVRLVDCDAIRIRGDAAVLAQLNAPDWDPPERTLSQSTDLYKFGLLVLRTLCPGNGASLYRDPDHVRGVLDGRGYRLLADAIGASPRRRPTARDWGLYFTELLGAGAPTTRAARISAPVVTTSGWVRDPTTRQWVQAGSDGQT